MGLTQPCSKAVPSQMDAKGLKDSDALTPRDCAVLSGDRELADLLSGDIVKLRLPRKTRR